MYNTNLTFSILTDFKREWLKEPYFKDLLPIEDFPPYIIARLNQELTDKNIEQTVAFLYQNDIPLTSYIVFYNLIRTSNRSQYTSPALISSVGYTKLRAKWEEYNKREFGDCSITYSIEEKDFIILQLPEEFDIEPNKEI